MHLALVALMMVGDVLVQRDGPAILTWDAPATSSEGLVLRFHERVGLTVSVIGVGNVEVRLPEQMLKTPGWREAERSPAMVERTKDGKTVWRRRITLEPLAPVDSVLQAEPVKFRIGEGDWQSASTAPVPVHILAHSTDDVPRDITGPEAVRPAVDPDRLDWRLPTLVAAAIGMIGLVFFLRRRERLAATPARVLAELSRLEALGLCDKGKSERHCTLLAGILRRYLDRRYGLPARRRTTEETLAAARQMPELAGDVEFLTSFLTACDNAKFAPIELAPVEGKRLTEELRGWLGRRQPEAQG